jgi:hypothetical protein
MILPKEDQTTYRDVPLPQITKGMIQEEVMSYHSSPDDALSWLENADNDSTGIITTRRDIKLLPQFTGTLTNPSTCKIVNNLVSNDRAFVYWQEGTNLKQTRLLTSSTIYSTTFFTTSTAKNRYDTYARFLVLTNKGNSTSIYATAGAQVNTTLPVGLDTKFPSEVDIVSIGFANRVWGASTDTTLSGQLAPLYYSDPLPQTDLTTLTTAVQQYVVINTRGESITALIQTPKILFIFTNNSISRLFETTSSENSPYQYVGTVSQESIVKTVDGHYFFHPSGIYYMNNTGDISKVSDAIYYLLKKIKPTNLKNVKAWSRDHFVYFYLGNLTGYDTNKYYFVRYNVLNKIWTINSTKTEISCVNSTALSEYSANEPDTSISWYPPNVIMSSTNGATLDIVNPSLDNQSVYGDFGTSASPSSNIDIDIQTKWYTFEEITKVQENRYKRINGLSIPHTNGQGLTVAVQMDNFDKDKWEVIGTLDTDAVTLFRAYQSSSPFNRCKFRFYGTSYGARIKIGMPTVIQLDDMGYKMS